MNTVSLLLLVCVAFAAAKSDKDNAPVAPVMVDVYYESLCPDSIKFITKQLAPAYKTFGKYIDLTLVPYGKSKHVKTENGTWTFDCHHGPNECFGNKVQACALHYLTDIKDKVDFINCVMDKVKPKSDDDYPGQKCAEMLKLSYDNIKTCSNSTEGDNELALLGDKTNKLSPKLGSVPTIVFQGAYTKKDSEQGEKDFNSVLCSYIGGSKVLKECKNSAVANQATILVSIMAAIIVKIIS